MPMTFGEQKEQEKFLQVAIAFEEVYPVEFRTAEQMIREGKTGMDLTNHIRTVCRLDMQSSLHIRAALIHCCLGRSK